MKTNTTALTGAALDWAVAKARTSTGTWTIIEDPVYNKVLMGEALGKPYSPSTNWDEGGPIIEREKIAIECERDVLWAAVWWDGKSHSSVIHRTGPTPLIAAMRCYVASELGAEVDIPDTLL